MQWFRVRNKLPSNRKFFELSDKLKVRLLFLWCMASKNDKGGILPSIKDMAFELRPITEADIQDSIDKLVAAELIDKTEAGFIPHDWPEHQYLDTGKDRTKRYRDKKKQDRDVTGDVTGDVTDTSHRHASAPSEQIQSRADAEQTRATTRLLPPLAGPSSEAPCPPALWAAFERCRELHPNCTDPDHAARCFLSLVGRGEIVAEEAPLMAPGMRHWLDSAEWAEPLDAAKYSATFKKFSKWITEFAWRGKPVPSAAAKQAKGTGKRSSDGIDPNAEYVAPWKKVEGVA